MLFATLLVLILIFLLINLIFYISIKRAFAKKTFEISKMKITVVTAARNEEKNIPDLITAISGQNYDKNLFEVIIVDDNSSDRTYEIAGGLIKNKDNFSIIKADKKPFPGKKGALTIGIQKAKYDFIMITDADCLPQKDWIKNYSLIFSKGYDFIFGVAPFFYNENKDRQSEWSRRLTIVNKSHFDFAQCDNDLTSETTNWVKLLSCFENLRIHILTFTMAIIGIPYSAAARNFGFKKSSFKKINGYENTLETLSGDDDLLLREAVRNKMKIGLVTEKDSFVYSKTKLNFKDYLKQKARHTETSLHYLPVHKFVLGFWHLINLLFLFSPFLVFVDSVFLSLFIIKLLVDLIVVFNLQKYFSYHFNPLRIIQLQVLYEIFIIINFFNALFSRIEWKK